MNLILVRHTEIVNNYLTLSKSDTRFMHIKKILHMREGDSVKIGVINGKKGMARITEFLPDKMRLSVSLDQAPKTPIPITLLLGCPRPIQLKRILKDVSSMGIASISLIRTDLAEASYFDADLIKNRQFEPYLIDGASQGVHTILPRIELFSSLEAALIHHAKTKNIFFCDVGNHPDIITCSFTHNTQVTIAIGSERGWSEHERACFLAHNYSPISLGESILRTETACISALAIFMAKLRQL